MNHKIMSLYFRDVQVKSFRKVPKLHWLDRSICLMLAVSFLAMMAKFSGEALAEYLMGIK